MVCILWCTSQYFHDIAVEIELMPVVSCAKRWPFRLQTYRSCVIGVVLGLAACSQTGSPKTSEPEAAITEPKPKLLVPSPIQSRTSLASDTRLEQGARLYAQYCAGCHGQAAEGSPAGPSLNGLGHTWHHPLHVLHKKTKNGFRQMPAFAGRLTDNEIDDVIAWFQSLWPETVYTDWQKRWYGSSTVAQ